MVGRCIPYKNSRFLGDMLVFRGVFHYTCQNQRKSIQNDQISSPLYTLPLNLTASSPLKTKGGSGLNIILLGPIQPIFRVEILVSGRLLPSEQTYTTTKN